MRDDPTVIHLVTRARTGDQQAWDALVERYAPLVWSICRRHQLGTDAHDVSQNVWLTLVRQLGTIRDPAALPGWLATTTTRECAKAWRAAQRPYTAGQALEAESIPDTQAATAERELQRAECHAALREAFTSLPPRSQQLMALLLEDPPVPHAQISARLGIPVGSIGPTRRRLLAKLRRHPAITALTTAGQEQGSAVESTLPRCGDHNQQDRRSVRRTRDATPGIGVPQRIAAASGNPAVRC
jgi:RNA polymerase sigma factor (sigma-70 family)